MRGPSFTSSALAARLLFTITLASRSSFAAGTTSVQDGDTFQAMADSAGIPVASLEAANPGVNADELYVGQALNIPSNNGPAAATPMSESESSTATGASPIASSATIPVSSTFSTSILPSSPTTTSPSSTSSTPSSTSTTPSSTSTAPSSTSTTPSSTSNTSSTTSSTPSPTSTIPPPSSTPPPASSTSTPAGPPTTPPVSPPSAPSCAPTPSGKYHDATQVQSKTNKWCSQVAAVSEKTIVGSPGMQISGSSQGSSGHDGNQPDEEGYNMTITAVSNMCDVTGATAQYPLGSADTNDNCSTILYNAWTHCNNKGMGGSITAGCLIYAFEPDP